MKSLIHLLFGSILLACSTMANSVSQFIPVVVPTSAKQAMTTPDLLKSVSLQAREEELAPLGRPPQPNRPISFATVFLTFENPDLQVKQITIEQVNIVDRLSQRSLLTLSQPRVLTLNPLEHSTIDIQLNQAKPYGSIGSVEAIVTYHLGDQIGKSSQIRSKAVTVDRS
jgi:hypothetical protein